MFWLGLLGNGVQPCHDSAGGTAIEREVRRHDDQLGAEPEGTAHRHGRVHAKGARRVGTRRDDYVEFGELSSIPSEIKA